MTWGRRFFCGGLATVMVAVTLATAVTTVVEVAPAAAAEPLDGLVATSISSAGGGMCAATEDAEVYCWGPDWDGFIGNGTGGTYNATTLYVTTPAKAQTTGVEVGMGCARTAAGAVQCWGFDGIIEDGDASNFSDPPWGANVPRDYGHGVAAQVAGRCALRTDGTVTCQGWDNWGQLGRGGTGWPASAYSRPPPSSATAVGVSGLNGVVDITQVNATVGASCAAKGDGTVWCWGLAQDGRMGDGQSALTDYPCRTGPGPCRDYVYRSTPVQVPGITDAVAVEETCALRATGAVSCWGLNDSQRFLTTQSASAILTPTDIPAFAGAVDIEVNYSATCAVFADGGLTCQGTGLLGDGPRHTTPATVDVPLHGKAVQVVAVDRDNWCVRYTSGRIDCWGSNTVGQLGVGYRSSFNEPVTGPTLTVGFTGRDLITGLLFETGTSGSTVKEGEATTIRFRVENLTQETLTNVSVTGVTVTAIDTDGEGAAAIGPAPGGNSMPDALGPRSLGQHLGFQDYKVDPTKAGVVRIAATATATGPDGSVETETFTYDLTIEPAPLKVELTARPLGSTAPRGAGEAFEFKLNENDHDNRFEVEVKVANQGDEAVESIDFLDPDAPIDFDSLLVDDEGVPVPGVAIEPLQDPAPDLPAHDLDPGESMTQTYTFEGSGEAHAELSTIVEGRMGTQAVSGRGVVEVKVLTDVLVEFGMKSSRPGPYLGGAPIRMDGVVRNVSDEVSVGVIAFPTTTGNGGNGNVFCPSSAGAACPAAAEGYDDVLAGPPGSQPPPRVTADRTPTGPVPMVLAPGQEVPLAALLFTTEMPVASATTVEWEVRAWKHEVDPDTGEVTKTRAADTQIEVLDDEGLDDDLQFSIPLTEPLPDVAGGECATDSLFLVLGCGGLYGAQRLGRSLADLVRLASQPRHPYYVRMLMWSGEYLARMAVALRDSPQARQALVDQIVADVEGYIDAGAAAASAAAGLPEAARVAVVGFIDRWVTILETGDYEELAFEIGKFSGENPDVVLGGAALSARVGRRLLARAGIVSDPVRAAVDAVEAVRVANLPHDLAIAEGVAARGGTPVHRSGVLRYGDPLTPRMLGDYLAADPRDVETAYQIAESEGVLLTFGSRVDEAVDAVRAGTAWPAPRELDFLPIDELDITYLKYPADRAGFVDLAQPPRDFPQNLYVTAFGDVARLTDEAGFAEASLDWVRRNHPGLDEAMTQRVASRLQTRVDEFVAGWNRFIEFEGVRRGEFGVPVGSTDIDRVGLWGPDVVRDTRGIQLLGRVGGDFAPTWTLKEEHLQGRVTFDEYEALLAADAGKPIQSRLYWELSFDASGTGQFRSMVDGGVQLLGVTALDGTRILSESKRARIYEKLHSLLGMRNGELADWVATGRADPLQESIADGAITATIGPGRQARASGFVAERSAFDTLNTGAAGTDFVLIAGYGYRLLHEPSAPRPYTRPSRWSLMSTLLNLPRFFALRSIWKFVDGLSEQQITPSYDRDGGGNIRPTHDHKMEVFVPSGSRNRSTSARAGGTWVPISVADAIALGDDPDTLELAPSTMVRTGLPGSTTLDVSTFEDLDVPTTSDWFVAGDRIVLDPGGPNEERVTVASVTSGSLVLTAPLAREHTPGEYVILETDGVSGTPTERFVRAAYRDLLGRAPTDAELAWTAARIDGGTPRWVITRTLARSTEWIGHLVDKYYADTLGRTPDAAGRAYWIDQIRTRRRTPAKVAALFYSSPEYFDGIGGGSRERWVTQLYQALLGRTPNSAGLSFWIDATQRRGRAWTATSFFNSRESRERRVRLLYLDLLGRGPDAGGLAYWADVLLRTGDDVGLAVELTASDEYFTRA